MTTNVLDLARLFESVRALGGEAPPAIVRVLETVDAFRNAAGLRSIEVPDVMMKAMKNAAAGTASMDMDEVVRLVSNKLVAGELIQHISRMEWDAAMLSQKLLGGDSGEELVDSLRPIADQAVQGIAAAHEYFSAETTAETVIEKGPDAAIAWNEAKEHQQVLDQVLNEVMRPLSRMTDLIPPELRMDRGLFILGVFMIDPDRAHLLPQVGMNLMQPSTSFRTPGGRWLKMLEYGGTFLNSPRTAIDTLRRLQDMEDELNLERYSLRWVEPSVS